MKLLSALKVFVSFVLPLAMVAALTHSHHDKDGCEHCALCALGPAGRREDLPTDLPNESNVAGGRPDLAPALATTSLKGYCEPWVRGRPARIRIFPSMRELRSEVPLGHFGRIRSVSQLGRVSGPGIGPAVHSYIGLAALSPGSTEIRNLIWRPKYSTPETSAIAHASCVANPHIPRAPPVGFSLSA